MKHPHAEMIIEWANDTSKQLQVFDGNIDEWCDCSMDELTIQPDEKYRFKPREFNEGEWYPCIDQYGDNGVFMYYGEDLFVMDEQSRSDSGFHTTLFKWIGESLGKLKFG